MTIFFIASCHLIDLLCSLSENCNFPRHLSSRNAMICKHRECLPQHFGTTDLHHRTPHHTTCHCVRHDHAIDCLDSYPISTWRHGLITVSDDVLQALIFVPEIWGENRCRKTLVETRVDRRLCLLSLRQISFGMGQARISISTGLMYIMYDGCDAPVLWFYVGFEEEDGLYAWIRLCTVIQCLHLRYIFTD